MARSGEQQGHRQPQVDTELASLLLAQRYLHHAEGEARIRAAYGARYERLARIKGRYDPRNVFRSNQNIKPEGEPPR